jgi:dynein heavy chain 1, cytosolic
MHAPMPELDEVAVSCGKIWTLWDDEADKIQTIFRDIGKKQRSTDSTKLFHRVPNRHKELEKRLEELHKFRFFNTKFKI